MPDEDLEERIVILEQFFKLALEVVPTSWLLAELGDRTHGGDRTTTTDEPPAT